MKSIADLEKIRTATLAKGNFGEAAKGPRVVVGLASCGIAAGAQPVLDALKAEVASAKLDNVVVSQTGCIGMCRFEPIVEITMPGQQKVTYCYVKPEMVPRIVKEHLVEGKPIAEYTIGAQLN